MTVTLTDQAPGPGELMKCLLQERHRFANEDEFIAFALAEKARGQAARKNHRLCLICACVTGKCSTSEWDGDWSL